MFQPAESVAAVLLEQDVVAGAVIGQNGPALVDEAAVPHIVEEIVESLPAVRKLVERGAHLGGVGRPPVQPDGEQHQGDDRIAEHGLILACQD